MKTKLINLPRHIAFIMDGNGRWAKRRGMPRNYGHKKGSERISEIIKSCYDLGIGTVSLYAFSCENKNRPKDEVDKIFDLLREFFDKRYDEFEKNDIKVRIMGDLAELPNDLKQSVEKAVADTKNKKNILNIGINYGARQEILRAVNSAVFEGKKRFTEQEFNNYLYTSGMPDPDLIIRTGGEVRLSNFMLYQAAYSELYFTKVYWPDFDVKQLYKALKYFSVRQRRYGKI